MPLTITSLRSEFRLVRRPLLHELSPVLAATEIFRQKVEAVLVGYFWAEFAGLYARLYGSDSSPIASRFFAFGLRSFTEA
jgi:hypothetical protein